MKMKMNVTWGHLALSILIILFLVACSNDDDGVVRPIGQQNIVEVATDNADLTSLVAALERSGLDEVLDDNGSFTVLAPSDEAFTAYLGENEYDGLEDIPAEVLEMLLMYHVINGELTAADLIADGSGYVASNADSPYDGAKLDLYFDATTGVEFNGFASVVQGGADVQASNGVIHVIDHVIDFPTVFDFIEADSSLEEIRDLQATEGQPDFATILGSRTNNDPEPITFFAPTNEAIAALSEVPEGETLTAIISHHVIGDGNIRADEITDGLVSPATVEGDPLTFAVSNDQVTIEDGAGNTGTSVVFPNIQAVNGVMHYIDGVLIPDTEN